MSQYRMYAPVISTKLAQYRKTFNLPYSENLWLDYLNRVCQDTDAGICAKEEATYLLRAAVLERLIYSRESGAVLFPESAGMVEMMLNANYSISPDSFRLPFSSFTLAFPKELDLPGAFVALQTPRHMQELYRSLFIQLGVAKHQLRNRIPDFPDDVSMDSPILYVLNRLQKESTEVAPLSMMRFQLSGLPDILCDFDAWAAKATTEESLTITANKSNTCHRLLRAICGLCVYLQAFKGTLVKGLPSGVKQYDLNACKNVQTGYTIQLTPKMRQHISRPHGSPCEHFRKLHFRSLHHDRFARDENGNVRIVEVNACVVNLGKEETPYTVLSPISCPKSDKDLRASV